MLLFLLYKCFACAGPRGTIQNSPNTCYFSGNIWKKKKVCYNLGLALCSRRMREDAKQNGKETWLKLKRGHQSRKARSLKLIQQKRGKNALCPISESSHEMSWWAEPILFSAHMLKLNANGPILPLAHCLIWAHDDISAYKFIKHIPVHFMS